MIFSRSTRGLFNNKKAIEIKVDYCKVEYWGLGKVPYFIDAPYLYLAIRENLNVQGCTEIFVKGLQ